VQVPLEGHVRIRDLLEIIYLLADSEEICGETTDTSNITRFACPEGNSSRRAVLKH